MLKTRVLTILAVAALALTGCAPTTTVPTPTPPAESEAPLNPELMPQSTSPGDRGER